MPGSSGHELKLAGWGRWGFNERRQMWLPVTPGVKAQTYNSWAAFPKELRLMRKTAERATRLPVPRTDIPHIHRVINESQAGTRTLNFSLALVWRDQVEVSLTGWLTCIWRYFLSAGLRHCRKGWFHEARQLAWLSGAFSRWLWPGNERAGRGGKGGGHRGDNRGGSEREKKINLHF